MKTTRLIVLCKPLLAVCLMAAALALPFKATAAFAAYPYTEGFEAMLNTNYWTLQGNWGPTWETAHSGASSLTDSPFTVYGSSQDVSATLGVDLRFTAVRPALTFWQRYAYEPNYDYGFVEVSRDQGATWTRLSAVTGIAAGWSQVQIDLSYYAGAQVLIRFRSVSNPSILYDGWYVDDVQIAENTSPPVFPTYDNMDTAASPGKWQASVWQQVNGSSTNAGTGMSWRCQIGNGYQPGGNDANFPLTLAAPLNLVGTINPKLSFWWRAGVQRDNTLYAQVSTDGGKNWGNLWSWNSYYFNSAAWIRQQVDLNSYIGYTNVALRFLAYNASGNPLSFDFQIDDFMVDEAPSDLAVTIGPGTDPRNSAQLTWTSSAAPDFAYYAIFRSTSPGVTPANFLVTTISNRNTTSLLDTNGLSVIGQNYYYRVLVYDTAGLHNWGTNDAVYRTKWGQLATTYPFIDGLENGYANWALDQPWVVTTQMSHSGTNCLASNPGVSYANNADASAYLNLDLSGATRPMLSFWQRYGFEPNQDYGFVEVSLNQGTNWTPLYAVTGQSGTNWMNARVDLGFYAGSQVLVRFRLKSDAQNPYTGWFIDDVAVQDFGLASRGYPFSDGMDVAGSQSNWVSSTWQQSPSSVQTNGTDYGWRCQIGNGYQPGGGDLYCPLTLTGTVNLYGALNPKLWFWWRAGVQRDNTLYAQVSTDGGKNWGSLWSWNSYYYSSAGWIRQQVELTNYVGYTNLALRFLALNTAGNPLNLDFQVDDVLVADLPAPAPNVAASVGPGTDPRHNSLLTWSASTFPAFGWYGIYRSTSTGVGVGSSLVAAITNQSTVSFQDTNLDVCGQTYYYRVIIWDTNGLHNTGGSDLAYTTQYGQLINSLPFADGLEGTDANWALDRPWSITSQIARGGIRCLASNPGTNYANNTDTSAYLNLNLTTANRPMLTFWQRYGLEPNQDYGFVEVWRGGWTRLYAVTGQSGTNWNQVQVDLGAYAGSQVVVRFRLKTDGQNQYDGWFVDDVAVKDFGMALGFPFWDNMDTVASPSNWVSSAWQQVPGSATSGSGMSWRCQIGNGYQPGGYDLNCPLTLAGNVNLTGTVNPKLSFWWRAGVQRDSTLYAQASTDGGKNWGNLWSWNSYYFNSAIWTRQQVDLNGYIGYTNLTLRFLAYNAVGNPLNLDFQIDEVMVDETPSDLAVSIGSGTDSRHAALINWAASTAPDFAYYAIYRSTSSGVSPSSLLVATITNRATTSFQDTNLDIVGQTYYYRVLVYDSTGLHNWGTNDISYRTAYGQLASFPFSENFESGDAFWACDRPWSLSSQLPRSGTNCLASNPGTAYANSADLSAYLNIDLAGATRPMLTFWQRYGFELNQDYGFVEVSLNQGATWTRLYAVTSQGGAAWSQTQVDLSGYAGAKVLIRFRLESDAQNPYDGWFIDDVAVQDFDASTFTYTFYDSFDSQAGATNWVSSSWKQVPGSAISGSGMSWRCQIGNGYQPGGGDLYCPLTLEGTVNLYGALNPKLWFWWRAGVQRDNTFYAQVSTDGGKNWGNLWSWNSYYFNSAGWTRQQVDMNSYIGHTNLTLRFLAYNATGNPLNLDFQIDDVLIAPGGDVPAILTSASLPIGTQGYSYSLILQATNGMTPYTWAVVSNSLPPGLTLDPASGMLSGTLTNTGTFNFGLSVTTSNALSAQRQFTLAVQDYLPFYPSQSSPAFISPGTNVVYCQINNQTGRRLLSLVWTPTLPSGWGIVDVQGDGSPSLGPDGKILFQSQYLTNNPLQFNYRVSVSAGQSQSQLIGGVATILLEGMAVERTVPANPNPLVATPRVYHSADYNTNWVIESLEASRVLAYWRAQAYHLDPTSSDGYAPGAGDQEGPLSSADYGMPFWQIDGTELNRVLAYWRVGCYHADNTTADGFAAGCTPQAPPPAPLAVQKLPMAYAAGSTFLITNRLTYTGTMLSLLWRPVLPAGWTFNSVLADGGPEVVNGEVVWTSTNMPPSPVQVFYQVQVPSGETGAKQIRNQIEYQTVGMTDALTLYATTDPALLNFVGLNFTALKRLGDGSIQLNFSGFTLDPVRIQAATNLPAASWTTLSTQPAMSGTLQQYIDTTATNQPQRFYRLITP